MTEQDHESFGERIKQTAARTLGTRHWQIVSSAICLGLALLTLLYYITGPALGYFHSDCTDSLLWAEASVRSGKVLDEGFAYAALLPFGSPLWMVPLLRLFGFGYTAHVWSMAVFALLFVATALFFFRSLRWRYDASSLATLCLCLLLSGSVKLREIMWGHVIYYSLGILLLMVLLGTALRLYRSSRLWLAGDRAARSTTTGVLWAVLLLILSVGTATDGMQMVSLVTLPVAAALLAYTLCDAKHKLLSRHTLSALSIVAVMALGTGLGLLLLNVLTQNGAIYAGYENAYSVWSPVSSWWTNAEQFFKQYITLMGVQPEKGDPIFAAPSVMLVIRLLGFAVLLIAPLLMLIRYRHIRHTASRLVLWAHLALSFVILFGFVCGTLSGANWRLVPMVGSAILCTAVYLYELIERRGVAMRFGVLLTVLLLSVSLSHAVTMLSMPYDYGKDDSMYDVIDTLDERGYTYGYASFWHASRTAVMSEGRLEVRNVNIQEGTVTPYYYQTWRDSFEQAEADTYFLLLTENEAYTLESSSELDRLCKQYGLLDFFTEGEYVVLVFDRNIFVE